MSNSTNLKQAKFLGPFTLAMLSVSAIISLRNLPSTALLGSQSITFFIAAGLCFFIPVALCCAELAAGWPKKGGVFLWVSEAFGKDTGFLAVWLQWVESVVWLPTILSFIAATGAYLIDPALENHRVYLVATMLFVLWGTTFLNFRGIKTSSFFSSFGVILGTLIPGVALIALGISHLPEAIGSGIIDFSPSALLPSDNINSLVIFTSILLGLCGMEIPAYHVQNVEDPRRDFPRAMFLATAIILAISILGSLAIAAVVPKQGMSLISGPMQAFLLFFNKFGLSYAVPILAFLTLIGSLALLNTWIIGPSKGLLSSTEQGYMPKMFEHTNKAGAPVTLLYLQAICGSLLISLFGLNPSIKAAYWMINTLAAQLYLLMYFLLFLAVIKLRISQPDVPRPYKIPGGMIGVWIIAGMGAITCLVALLIGFLRPSDIEVHQTANEYATMLLAGMVICSTPPLFIMWYHKKKHKK